jgi:predicted ATPase
MLFDRWQHSKEGAGQLVLLSGEAGIGKSRLVQLLKEQVTTENQIWVEFHCSPYYQNSALYPVIDLLQRSLSFIREDSPAEKLRKLEEALEQSRLPLSEDVPLLASLLSLPLPDRYPPLLMTPQRQRQKTLDALLAWLLAVTQQNPLLLIGEDLHWADPSTLELLGLLIEKTSTARVLAILTARPEFSPPWTPHPQVIQIALGRLVQEDMTTMIEHVAKGKALPGEVQQQLMSRTDGVPLFIEELTKMVLESGLLREENERYELLGPLPPLAIPTTLQDSLMARLDRLATVREVAQLGATLGREFSYELIQAVLLIDDGPLQRDLATLVDAELLYQYGTPPQARYVFKHALIQEAAYQSLLKSRRQQYHQRIALVLEVQFPETKETQPELLAHHYTEAGLTKQAIPFWQRAGEKAVERSANAEAIRHLTKGLELLKLLPKTGERTQQELFLQTTLGPALMATKGYAAEEVEHLYARARELCQQLGETLPLFPVLYGLVAFYAVRARTQTANEVAEQLFRLARKEQDPNLLLVAYEAQAQTLYLAGDCALARQRVEQGIALYDPQKHRSLAFLYGEDPGVVCRAIGAWALWSLGYPDQALQMIQGAITLAQDLSLPFSLAQAFAVASVLHQLRRDQHAVQTTTAKTLALSDDQGFPLWAAMATVVQGWAVAEQGQGEKGIAQIHQGLAEYRLTGAGMMLPYFLALLAEAQGRGGQAEEGLVTLTEALQAVDQSQERFYEAELHRLKGELLLKAERKTRI